ncbi:MerR family transcriptional regulator [Glycomyces terrestris]|uniref:MerR family transcriptional regulator n=1 Tax=Glycomyces terrestris TaxID=2493553 RepID=A0A426UWY6_9ACTN|nr:MerR family transcriptional regulator [Glycomyces terrestris]
MLIGELSRRTGVSARLLRYYEEQELLVPDRDANGYRTYGDDAPAVVERIRELLDSGLSTKAIREILPCSVADGIRHCDHSRAVLGDGLSRLEEEIAALEAKRRLLAGQVAAAASRPREAGPGHD